MIADHTGKSVLSRILRWIPALALVAGAVASPVTSSLAHAAGFPSIRTWALQGAFRDSTRFFPGRCAGLFKGPGPDSLRLEARALTVRFLRDRVAEARPDFAGYRIYRMTTTADSSQAKLIRRYSQNAGSELTWHFSVLDTATMQYICNGLVVHDSILTFVDPDSNGQFQKVCRRVDNSNRCLTPGDSVVKLVAPPGPHDGFLTWYSVTYEKRNTTDTDYEDLFLPDTLDGSVRCANPANRLTCPNLNNKLRNLAGPVEPTAGPTADLEGVIAVPNPYRGNEVWDPAASGEVHFINLPKRSTIKVFTVAGDLVRTIEHNDTVRDFERWDLKTGAGKDVASGIYLYRVTSGSFSFQNRLVIIR
jgi:hypothetical protein